jgi:hypothetical protein
MQIEEFSNFYRLVESMTCAGLLATFIVGILALFVLSILFKFDPVIQSITKHLKTYLISMIVLFFAVIVLFKSDANTKRDQIMFANQIKSGMIFYEQKIMDYEDLVNYYIIDSNNYNQNDLDEIVESFPTEFTKVYYGGSDLHPAIRIIDPESLAKIDNYYQKNLPFLKESILNYMSSKMLDSISYAIIQDSLNGFYATEWIELMLNNYDSLFTPIVMVKHSDIYESKYGIMRK